MYESSACNSGRGGYRPQDFERRRDRLNELYAESARTNWRVLPSFTANLDRLGHGLLDTDTAWVQIGRAVEQGRLSRRRSLCVDALAD